MAIIKNVDKLRIRDITEMQEAGKILVIDDNNVVQWINADDLDVDLSGYYTKIDIDAILEDYYDKSEVDALLSDIDLSDYYTKTEVDDLLNNIPKPTLSDVTEEGNTTDVKMIGSEVFSNTMKEDFAQIKDVNDSGWGLLPLQSEMKIALTAKDGTTVLSSIDVSWLASGDLAVSIDDTDPQNPELVFSQGGVEVARIPASTLLSGVVRGGDLSDYILQFKDGNNTVLFGIDLENLFDQHYTITEADGRFALRTRTISGTGGLTGGGDLTDDRTIDLTATAKSDINKGVEAHDWVSLGGISRTSLSLNSSNDLDLVIEPGYYHHSGGSAPLNKPIGGTYAGYLEVVTDGSGNYIRQAWRTRDYRREFQRTRSSSGVWSAWVEYITADNLDSEATSLGFIKSADLSGYVPSSRSITSGTGLTGGGDLTDDRTIGLSTSTQSDIAKGVTAHGWGDFREFGLGDEAVFKTGLFEDINESGFYAFSASQQGFSFPRAIMLHRGSQNYGIIFSNSRDEVGFITGDGSSYNAWHSGNLNPSEYATETWVNSQGFLKSNSLNNYYTKTEALNQFVGLAGVQSISDTKTFLASPVVPNPTLDAHAVNKGWVEENYKLQLVKIQNGQSIPASSTVFLKLNNIDFTEGDIPITIASNDEEIIVDEEGVYSIDVLSGGVGISGILKVLINNSQQDMPLLFSGSNNIVGSGNFVYKLNPNDTIKLSVENQDNQSNSFNYTIILRKLN